MLQLYIWYSSYFLAISGLKSHRLVAYITSGEINKFWPENLNHIQNRRKQHTRVQIKIKNNLPSSVAAAAATSAAQTS